MFKHINIFNEIIKNNYFKIALANILQQIISLITTSYLIKSIGSIDYSNIVLFLVIAHTLLMFLNCWINPFYIREASLEYEKNKKINISLSIVLITFSLITLLFIFLNIIGINNILELKNLTLLFFFILAQIFIYISKLTFRIRNEINTYVLILIFEKLFFLMLIFLYFQIEENFNIDIIIEILSYSYFFISIIFIYPVIKNFKIKLPGKNLVKNYLKNSTYIFFATIFVYFTSYEYLIIILSESELKLIITFIAIGYMFSNFIYMPVYWLEQLIGPKVNVIFNSNQNYYKKIYYEEICMYFLFFSYLVQIIIINLLLESDILILLFDESFIKNIYYVVIVIFISSSKLIDTLFSIPIFAKKLEKKILLFNITKALIFLFFYLVLNISIDNLIILFIVLSYLQNFFYIFLNLKLVKNYLFYKEIIYLIINILGFYLFLYTNLFYIFSIFVVSILFFILISKKLIVINSINKLNSFIN